MVTLNLIVRFIVNYSNHMVKLTPPVSDLPLLPSEVDLPFSLRRLESILSQSEFLLDA